jgi:hypothetical protein
MSARRRKTVLKRTFQTISSGGGGAETNFKKPGAFGLGFLSNKQNKSVRVSAR